jgi:DnaJ domain
MLAIKRSADKFFFSATKYNLVAGPIVQCPVCYATFNLYATPASMVAAEKALVEYLQRNCPRHAECFGADESRIRAHCRHCMEAYDVLGLMQGEGNRQMKTAYRELAKKWHPDKFSAETDERLRQEAHDHFQKISKAYKHLTSHR